MAHTSRESAMSTTIDLTDVLGISFGFILFSEEKPRRVSVNAGLKLIIHRLSCVS